MVNAYIFTKSGDSTSGLVHTFGNEAEAWEWVKAQDTKGQNVIVANEQDIMLAWRIFGANRRDDDDKRIQKAEGPDAG